ncbi:MAG: type II toxin-antitoxin system HicB family antitoxin [Candidatus Berkelbacteria bacterium]|nr:type II toxin-antitoxin system HicB family antitoxin [Candidatus Berkelbacteria bacterium]
MKRIHYNLIFRSEPEGGYTVMVPSLPGCITYGKNLEQAKKNAYDAINGYVASLNKHKEPIPTDDTNFITSVDLEIATPKSKTYA